MASRSFYRYYQTNEKSKWQAVPDTEQDYEALGAKRVSILAVSPLVTEDNKDDIFYKGPFYVDIDNKELATSIESAQKLLQRIEDWGIPRESYQIFCSGSKGFHFYFHEKLFYSGRPSKKLPDIYSELARYFHVTGIDFQVYCKGKGNLFRLPNVQREDGKYKVFVTAEELKSITPEQYQAFTSAPRIGAPPLAQPEKPVTKCLEIFQAAEKDAERQDEFSKYEPTPVEALTQFAEDPPACIDSLCDGDIRPGVNFNSASMQLAIFVVRAGTSKSTANSLTSLFAAKNKTSLSYSSEKARIEHVEGLVSHMVIRPDRQFSCAAMRSVLASRPCKNCPLENLGATSHDYYDIEEKRDGYYMVAGKSERRLTNFILVPFKTIHMEDLGGTSDLRRAYTLCMVEQMGERVAGVFKVEEEAWLSRSAFLKCFTGVGNLRVTANDNDVQLLKHWVMRDTEKIEGIIEVPSVGIHCNIIHKRPRFTYVEKGFSVNKWGMPDTHSYPSDLSYESSALPRLTDIYPSKQTDYSPIVNSLFNFNEPGIVAPLLGWLSACHLKAHIMWTFHEFPLYVLWGGRGSGKTKTASVVAGGLHACDYQTYAPPSIGQATPFAVLDTITKTTTVPRVLDEFNKHGMRPGQYEQYTEFFKSGYNNAAVSRGRLLRANEKGRKGIGATTDHFFVTSPILLLSEHAPEVPALLDRSFLSMLREPSLEGRQEHMRNLSTNYKRVYEIAKTMVLKALYVRPEWISDKYDEWADLISPRYNERQSHTRRVIGVGLDYLKKVLVEEMAIPVEDGLATLTDAYLDHCKTYESVAEHAGYQTEIDRILMRLGGIISMAKRTGTDHKLPRDMYQVNAARRHLYLDPVTAFLALEEQYANRREVMPIRQPMQFIRILSSEKYYVGQQIVDSMGTDRPVLILDLDGLEQKGLDISLFL